MRITKNDINLIGEAYVDMHREEDAEGTQQLHPLLQEIQDEIHLGIRIEDFIDKASKALGVEWNPRRGKGLAYFLKTVGNAIKWDIEYQPEDGGYIMGVEDLSEDDDFRG